MHLLIIEDNADIIANLYSYLEPLGYKLDVARSGKAGVLAATTSAHDAIVLDLSLPAMDGIEVCRQLRQQYQLTTPILMLTARDTEQDKVTGFAVGADDYLVKPYSLAELDARLKALVRRARNEHVQSVLVFGELQLDAGIGRISRAGQTLDLTPTGYRILSALMRVAPKLITREALERQVWGDEPPDSDALRTHIHTLRRVLDKPFSYPVLLTLPGTGYRLMLCNEERNEGPQ